jgi:hypothetical protein
MGRIDPVVGATAHNMVAVHIALVDRDLTCMSSLSQTVECASGSVARTRVCL